MKAEIADREAFDSDQQTNRKAVTNLHKWSIRSDIKHDDGTRWRVRREIAEITMTRGRTDRRHIKPLICPYLGGD